MLSRSFIAGLLAALALAAPAAAMPLDLRNPDTARQDLRMPDTRDAARRPPEARQDLRMPDTRDAAQRPPVASPTPAPSSHGDVPWALVGAGLGALLLVGVAARRRRAVRLRPA
jgi:hypothetical protein